MGKRGLRRHGKSLKGKTFRISRCDQVSMDEFFEGMMHIVLSHVPIQHIQMMKKLEKGQAQIEGLIGHLMDLEKSEASNEMGIMEDLRKLHEKVDALSR